MSDTVTLAQAIARLREFDRKGLRDATKSAFYRALQIGRQRAVATLGRTQLGRMVQRRGDVALELGLKSRAKKWKVDGALGSLKRSTIPLIVRRAEMTPGHAGIGLRSGLEAMGFAALIESGGRTKPHQINRIRLAGYSRKADTRAKQVAGGPPLTFQVGGKWVSPRVVRHPGSHVPRNPFLGTGAEAAARALPGEFERSLLQAVQKAGL